MRTQHDPAIIFSVYQNVNAPNVEEVNVISHDAYRRALTQFDVPFKEVSGVYKGVKEKAFLVLDTPANRTRVETICDYRARENFLLLDEERNASLYYTASKTAESIGKWREVSESQAKQFDGYTFDPTTDRYYVAN